MSFWLFGSNFAQTSIHVSIYTVFISLLVVKLNSIATSPQEIFLITDIKNKFLCSREFPIEKLSFQNSPQKIYQIFSKNTIQDFLIRAYMLDLDFRKKKIN